MKYKIGDIIKLKNGTLCKIVDFHEESLSNIGYNVEIQGRTANFIVTDDMIERKYN